MEMNKKNKGEITLSMYYDDVDHCYYEVEPRRRNRNTRTWDARSGENHPLFGKDLAQLADETSITKQDSYEFIYISDSEGVTVNTTDTQVGLTLQAAIQAAIVLIVNISIASSEESKEVIQKLTEYSKTSQVNYSRYIVENSRDVSITATKTDIAATLQILVQLLIGLLITLDIL